MENAAASSNQVLIAGLIFVLTYAVIVSEKVHRTVAALIGGFLMIWLGILSQEEAFADAVDWNVIFLLTGMMIIAGILSQTGVFQWLAIQAVKMGKRDPFRILIFLSLVTAVTSAALDNVTVVVLIAPVTLYVASNLGISPIPFLIAEVLASNIGGAATLIGDPPNILIGSAAGIDFITFAAAMTPPVLLSLVLFVPIAYFVFKKELVPLEGARPHVGELDTDNLIKDAELLRKSLIVIGLVLVGFTAHGALNLEPATIAMSGAALLLVWSKTEPDKALEHVEWTTLLFFVGLFITVEAIVKVGIIEDMAQEALKLTDGDLGITTMFVLWISALASGIVDNIPYTATMIPLIQSLGSSGMNTEPLWWALALGADLGGNLTLVGASANVVVASLAERNGHKISFIQFSKYSFFVTLGTMLSSTVFLWFFHVIPNR